MTLPPYAYVPGHGLPHPVTDPRGHLAGAHARPLVALALQESLPPDAVARHRALAATLTGNLQWLSALDLFNEGFCWEAHEVWEGFWHALGRSTPEARFIQGLIHLAAAAVKIREGTPAGVRSHTQRARYLLGGSLAACDTAPSARAGGLGAGPDAVPVTLGLDPESLAAVLAELDAYQPACWHTSRAPVVRVVACELRLAACDPGSSRDLEAGRRGVWGR